MKTEFNNTYANYFDLAVGIDRDTRSFRCFREGRGVIAENISLSFESETGEKLFDALSFGKAEFFWEQPPHIPQTKITERLTEGGDGLPAVLDVVYTVTREGIYCEVVGLPDGIVPVFCGSLHYGDGDDSMAVCLDRDKAQDDFRSAYGPAVSKIDDSIFDRRTDSAVTVSGSVSHRLCYSWADGCYGFTVKGKLSLTFTDRVYEGKFRTRYKPINKHNTFPKPPAGWMTWYAVMFDACEEKVIANAEWQKKYLADYGADTVWVDWEWYHSAFHNPDASDNIGYFSPYPVRYPNGMKYVSDRIRELGFIPALWIGPTCEPAKTATFEKYIGSVYAERLSWCGKYFFDITDERIRDELIPDAINKVTEWGYDALKWDCLPITLAYADQYHECLKHPDITSVEALRAICEKARDILGEDFYMLSCAGVNDREVLMASDIFDGARIGNDIFTWKEFISDFVERIMRFYPYHNVVLYCDPDNVVIRPEFNNIDQAKSRVSAVSVLGLPITLGDDLTVLPEERVELIRRTLPTLNIHPKDIRESIHDGRRFLVNLAVSAEYEDWNVVDLLNLLEEEASFTLAFDRDLHLDDGEYLVFDYWNRNFLGRLSDSVTVTLPGTASAVLSVRKVTGHPQILSTSRHITQGAAELSHVRWDDTTKTLSGYSEVVAGDGYRIYVYVPEGYTPTGFEVSGGICVLEPDCSSSGTVGWSIEFG